MKPQFQCEEDANGRRVERFTHNQDKGWGYTGEDHVYSFAVVHPRDEKPDFHYPMVLALHFSGCGIDTAIKSTYEPECQDLFKHAEDCFMVIPDNNSSTYEDNWWGGIAPQDEADKIDKWKLGAAPNACENRIMGVFMWAVEQYKADRNRLYCVGVSMGGNAALAGAVTRGDIFAAVKVAVPAGVRRLAERCDYEGKYGFEMPEPPVLVEYSAQNDTWSGGHGLLYKCARKKKIQLMSYWGNFNHDCSDTRIPKINDLINTFNIYDIKKNEAYPVFLNADCDDKNPWETPTEEVMGKSGQMNAYFRWRTLKDTEDTLEMELRLVSAEEIGTSFDVPKRAAAEVYIRRLQSFSAEGNAFPYTFGDDTGKAEKKDGLLHIPTLTVTTEPKILKITK